MTHTHRKNAHWNKIKQIIDDKSFLSTASSLTKDPEVVSVVNDLQRQVLLYGEEYLLSLPGYRHRKQQIDGLLELTGKLQKVLSGNDVIHSARKRKILKKFYKRIAKTLVYEECSRKT
ncbi:hypothetical protein DPMN_153019 [Dreissena polymorpha]|uniref:Uncharacterized protein n=2 Tax=Dreissena polymorpha TaxID=45954 RepID=A0A9D4FMB4_DREPO|nr:hypothetical protein DPMN_152983 [Dreissena polymorpha]KAH3799411.1 hypothetical protein DPMN_153019 [Dreissena polymorpha]